MADKRQTTAHMKPAERSDAPEVEAGDKEVRIVVLTHGWVLVGYYRKTAYGVHLDQSAVVRVWGTEHGLGQIAIGGPTKSTVLDPQGYTDAPHSAVIFTIKCDGENWLKHLV